jgi:hypothetical protein
MQGRVKVLFIMGHGSSGTTILGNTLGEADGVFHAGELRTIWAEGLAGKQTCGCGEPLDRCPVWSAVIREAFGDLLPGDVERYARLHRWTIRVRNTARILRANPETLREWPALQTYADVATRLYRAIGAVTGARIVVDSSKRTGDAALLRLLPDVDPHLLHVVRDPRAVAYSWSNRSADAPGQLATAGEWLAFSGIGEAVKWRLGPGRSLLVRHEDFVRSPGPAVERILRFAGEAETAIPVAGQRSVEFTENHTVAGHWSRFNRGPTDIRLATDWRSKQRPADRRLVTAVTFPLLPRYGYPIRTPR